MHACHYLCVNFPAADLRGGAVVPVGHPHRHVVVGAAGGVQAAGDGDGARVPLDVKVPLLVATWWGEGRGSVRGPGKDTRGLIVVLSGAMLR